MSVSTIRKAMDIEQLVVWALVDNGLGRLFEDGRLSATWRELGTRVSSSGGAWDAKPPGLKHDDAVCVIEAIGQLHPDCAALIVRHGRIGDRPDWIEEGVGEWRQMIDGQGRPMWRWADPSNRSRKRSERSPRMEFVGETQSNVDYYRAQHDLWWVGLHDLVAPLNEAMTGHQATGPRAPDRPWLAPATVFGPDGKPMEGLHDSAARKTALRRRGNIQQPEAIEPDNVHRGSSAA